jgi:very-short-patch-repair endonuclease
MAKIRRRGVARESSPYQVCPPLSPAERAFWLVLQQCLPADTVLFTKVRLGDIIKVKSGLDTRTRQSHLNRITSKHADFVVCDAGDLIPRVVLELDDSSHQRRSAADRDAQKDAILEGAGLHIIRVKAQRTYNTAELRQNLAAATADGPAGAPTKPTSITEPPLPTIQADPAQPACPKCGSEMVRRKAKQGANTGREFWGCARYPHCKGIVAAATGNLNRGDS